MYIALYNENFKHITNVSKVTYELTQRVYDLDSFIATGFADEDVRQAKFLILKEETGNIIYFSFVDDVKLTDNHEIEIKGLDPKILLDNDILLDYTAISDEEPDKSPFSSNLKNIIDDVMKERFAFLFPGLKIRHTIAKEIEEINTENLMPNLQHQYLITNARAFIDPYLRVFQCRINIKFEIKHEQENEITFEFIRNSNSMSINLVDFRHELTTSNIVTNATMATIEFDSTYEDGELDENGIPLKSKHRPNTIASAWYFLRNDNNIEQVQRGQTPDFNLMIFPIKFKMYEAEWLAQAQIEAVYELAKNRYADNIVIDNNSILDPIDFANLDLLTMINVYYNGTKYKDLPITEKITTFNVNGKNTRVKLGFRKTLLTEIIKGG